MTETRHSSAGPPAPFDGDTGHHFGLAFMRFLLTMISLVLLIPLAYLMRLRDWIERILPQHRRPHVARLSGSVRH